ncbi:DciA family protein [Streptomyces sp. G35A]
MTETTAAPTGQAGTGNPTPSGVDLARVALHAAREAARKRGDTQARTPRRHLDQRGVKRDGREPNGLAAVLQGLMAERAWAIPAAGGSVLDQWPSIAASISPQLPDHVSAVAFHPETGQLDLRPDSPAYATQLRLITARIIAAANSAVGTDAVRAVRVLPVGAGPVHQEAGPASEVAAAAQPPVNAPAPVSRGYQQAMAAHLAAAPDRRMDPSIAEVAERQIEAIRELSRRAFPDDQPAPLEAARAQHRKSDAARALALRRARTERARARKQASSVTDSGTAE